ncbi:hypothetical protein BURMUCGD2_3364 [Burkholderia multivorans CGD2]|uniref:Uncharacterized protein n=1 Tax=Burkholderia multivorans CGD2 TaxID=513052 RepID=B9BW35_9BURK|nr:hypothetical protein BURMUCGD2_3364 [Burkholderia multivorans CGD2]
MPAAARRAAAGVHASVDSSPACRTAARRRRAAPAGTRRLIGRPFASSSIRRLSTFVRLDARAS